MDSSVKESPCKTLHGRVEAHVRVHASIRPSVQEKKVVVESSFLPPVLRCLLCSLVRDLKCTIEKEEDAAAIVAAARRLRRRFSNLISVIADHAATAAAAFIVVVAVCPPLCLPD